MSGFGQSQALLPLYCNYYHPYSRIHSFSLLSDYYVVGVSFSVMNQRLNDHASYFILRRDLT